MIPLSIPHLGGNEWKYIKHCLDTGWVSSAGAYVNQFEQMVAEFAGAKFGIAASNGTSGLHMALHVLGVDATHHVIVPNITFIASANSVMYTGAEPIFVDIDPKTWQMDLDLLEKFLEEDCYLSGGQCFSKQSSKPITAIMPVHVLGNICDMDQLCAIAEKWRIKIVEDASESLGSYYKGKHSGGFGKIGVFSFNGNKIITTGGGGVIVTDDESIAKRAKHLTTQAKVNPETYYHDEIGFNYRLVNILAAMGVAQMEQLNSFIQKKKNIDEYYRNQLMGVGDIQFQEIPETVDSNCWLVTVRTKNKAAILATLKQHDIIARPFWTPMNQLPMFQKYTYISEEDYSRAIHSECLSIPSSVNLTEQQLEYISKTIKSTFKEKSTHAEF
ncbi:MAG: LegC family aminotransferase [Bacteroidota bacterium]